jgi:hypothetical protein
MDFREFSRNGGKKKRNAARFNEHGEELGMNGRSIAPDAEDREARLQSKIDEALDRCDSLEHDNRALECERDELQSLLDDYAPAGHESRYLNEIFERERNAQPDPFKRAAIDGLRDFLEQLQ